MKKVSRSEFEKAKEFIQSKARDLEQARFEFLLKNGSKENVMEFLKPYQNEDGGFGHGIEPDFWLPKSSPMATWAAGQILIEVGADANDPVVESMISYLVETYHLETGMWCSVLPENNDHPHAPWWHWRKGVQDNWMFNPGAELAAFLVHWSSEESPAAHIGWSSIEKAVAYLMEQTEMDRHEINNFQQLVNLLKPSEAVFNSKLAHSLDDVSEKVMLLAVKCVEKDPSTWAAGYKALPLDFIDDPSHPLCEKFGPLVDENLNFYIDQMTEEGIWDISWNWGSYPKEFEVARRYWKGVLAVNRYKQLKEFGCLE
ncbi:hypothetical protein [Pseudalkalibacillus caeni]|uniref:Prenyltransferase n=1 Tax=Exobacillus caeni TaxID=2574798 RepID=A0A5R9F893_9BACL|nr:hypothetical protein [Pseudalkalibacillus caeni]TLS37063.1 hypothetical protein FCL54_11065 [Pseudalkalibacillus caeni]